jgi:hypothetical protein
MAKVESKDPFRHLALYESPDTFGSHSEADARLHAGAIEPRSAHRFFA